MRKKIVAGNWKMNKNLNEGIELASAVKNLLVTSPANVKVVLSPPYIHLGELSKIADFRQIHISAQNCACKESGAYTGEVSPAMVRSTGADHVILGHSERRSYYGETDDILCEKVKLAIANGLYPIFCIGEVLTERKAEKHFEVVKTQLEKGLFHLSKEDFGKTVIAYEPVWAIGTGVTASPAQAQEMHAYIRSLVAEKYGQDTAENTSILYGGSCKPSNAKELFANADVDGGLIGGAALNAEDFVAIVNSF